MKKIVVCLMSACVLFCSACGQKGPLYLPAPDSKTQPVNETK